MAEETKRHEEEAKIVEEVRKAEAEQVRLEAKKKWREVEVARQVAINLAKY